MPVRSGVKVNLAWQETHFSNALQANNQAYFKVAKDLQQQK